jgi:hypothetical protein
MPRDRRCEQRVNEPAVADIDLGRLDQPLADVAVPRSEAAHEEQVYEQLEVSGDRLAIHGEGAGERRGVEESPC